MRTRAVLLASTVCIATGAWFVTYWIRHRADYLIVPAALAFVGGIVMLSIQVAYFVNNKPRKGTASRLGGRVLYDSVGVADALVDECSPNWKARLSSVTTDSNGYFEFPSTANDTVHHLKFSWPYASVLRLDLKIAPDAPPLEVELPAMSDWNRRRL